MTEVARAAVFVYVVAGLVYPGAEVALDGHLLVRRLLSVQGVHNYHPRHLVQALGFVDRHRRELPLGALVGAHFPLTELDGAFRAAAERKVVRAAVMPSLVV